MVVALTVGTVQLTKSHLSHKEFTVGAFLARVELIESYNEVPEGSRLDRVSRGTYRHQYLVDYIS